MATQKEQILNDVHTHSISIPTREIYIHGHYNSDEEPGVDYRLATTFIKNINILDAINHQPILIHQHTVGGEWNDGMAMFDAIKACESKVTILMYAHARSMSSIIPQAADIRIMMPNTDFMIHYGTISIDTTHSQAKSNIEWNEYLCEVMLDIYVERCRHGEAFKGMTMNAIEKILRSKMDKKVDWFLTAKDAVHHGFADAVFGDKGYESISQIHPARKIK